MSIARRIVPGTTYLVTRRCTQRQFLLKPSKRVNQVFRFCLAWASERTGVEVHAAVVLSNHYHLVVTDRRGELPSFAAHLNKYVAKCLNATYGRWENLWAANEQTSYVELASADAVLEKTVYTITNAVSSGLVSCHKRWPGLVLYQPESYRCKRPDVFFREVGPVPESLMLELTPPPLGMSRRQCVNAINRAVAAKEAAIRAECARLGKRFAGLAELGRQRIDDTPWSREPRRKLSPRVASRNKWLRIEALTRLAEFVTAYKHALARWCTGDRTVVFPHGTYAMRVLYQVPCAAT